MCSAAAIASEAPSGSPPSEPVSARDFRLLSVLVLLLFAFVPSASNWAQSVPDDTRFRIVVWLTDDPSLLPDPSVLSSDDAIATELLERARLWLSGMIFGWDFRYQVDDPLRQRQATFVLEPVGEIPFGFPGLRVVEIARVPARVIATVDFRMPDDLQHYRRYWTVSSLPRVQADGGVDLRRSQQDALEAGLEQAVRNVARGRYRDRPVVISGSVGLITEPRFRYDSGQLIARVDAAVDIRSVEPNTAF